MLQRVVFNHLAVIKKLKIQGEILNNYDQSMLGGLQYWKMYMDLAKDDKEILTAFF